LSSPGGSHEDNLKIGEIIPHSTPDPLMSTSTTPYPMYSHNHENVSPDLTLNKRNYKLISSSSRQIYRTVSEPNPNAHTNQANEQFSQLTLSQLELLENYDPMISAKIGVPFIPVQMLARPRDAQQSSKRSIQQIHRDYPKYYLLYFHFFFSFYIFLEKMVNRYLNHVLLLLLLLVI
jgi:hypothetical protein